MPINVNNSLSIYQNKVIYYFPAIKITVGFFAHFANVHILN